MTRGERGVRDDGVGGGQLRVRHRHKSSSSTAIHQPVFRILSPASPSANKQPKQCKPSVLADRILHDGLYLLSEDAHPHASGQRLGLLKTSRLCLGCIVRSNWVCNRRHRLRFLYTWPEVPTELPPYPGQQPERRK